MAGFNVWVLCQTLLRFVLLKLVTGLSACIFRLQGGGGVCWKDEEKEINVTETEQGLLPEEDVITELNSFEEEEEEPEVFLKFKFPTYEEFRQLQKESGNELDSALVLSSRKSCISGFIDEQETNGKGLSDGNLEEVYEAEMAETEQEEEETQGIHGESVVTDSDSDLDSSHGRLINHLVDSYRGGFHGNRDDITDNDEEEILHNRDGLTSDSDNTNGVEFLTTDEDPGEKTEWGDEENELESLWEHQELVEQLKMELKKMKATGLPTILEESESPKIADDLKPWKIDEFHRVDCIGELHKFYKSYRERMRKFDIINYQKMYAMGVLQLRDPLQFTLEQRQSAPAAVKSFLLQKLPAFRNKIHGSDPMKKFMHEVQADLEVVYVAQMCLSWEFLNWQYDKVLDLWDSDPRGIRQYNKVAGEFQQFQVLMQRFVEDEPFQSQPRMQNYVRTRGHLRNLLQVPVVREDNVKDRKRERRDEYVITSDMLVEIVEESIRIFWRFVRADKDCSSDRKMPEVTNPEDVKLVTETRKILAKKERKLKDLVRSENCVLRKLRRCREDGGDDSDQVLYFFSQVDMKLVCRVLNMAKITRDQLIWCRRKLDRIGFLDRKIYVEPAFLLFPS